MAEEAVRISIDGDVCIGAGQCALTSPDVFTQDDDGFGTVVPGREDGTGTLVREAARACPVQAITLHAPADEARA
ncbi:ferredoxin [Streptomyces tanashiensis]|uniref:Ferredoxin n=1 Tax=Streptomyces tanashiensis TaxID=67367 RepID=A0ABY6QR12_9ACTN|nr:ferredoxin [Streptomyces tanashiensis]UZX19600.1 ferredoxin [Streptomyces tanashiensis]GGY18079.1 ferredoxin [Streptomyces tanashiensis]